MLLLPRSHSSTCGDCLEALEKAISLRPMLCSWTLLFAPHVYFPV
jgi:hypothetical protein